MMINQAIGCADFPCSDVKHDRYILPAIDIDPGQIKAALISEAAPPEAIDYYYAAGDPLFVQTTVLAFLDAGADVGNIEDLLGMGIYMTTAVKCGKIDYGIKAGTINECALILEQELTQFPNLRVLLLMGDVAIKAVNAISRRAGQGRVIPAGATYKIRNHAYYYGNIRVFPSYLQAGPSFFIEKSKRRMIAEDLKNALEIIKN